MTPEQKAHREFYEQHSGLFADQPWFSYSPNGDFLFFSTEKQAREQAESEIEDYLDDTWDEDVEGIFVGKATLVATKTNVKKLPPGSECDYECDYDLLPPEKKGGKAVEQQGESPVDALMAKVERFATTYASARNDESSGALLEGLQGLEDAKELYSELREELEQLVGSAGGES
ncbi:hypothetical protein ACJJIU_22230 (plasmid) [Microbulbifer sp. CnH-101-E]|uniref:hypothetical protein n=1 Tax=unclassified Microbulbifer TaxID=2619833 RepID=UPI00403950D0